uniref:Uncharacterized protein n=1 Tax=Globodera pallida TaxID=36090 RepID=A0A183BUE6_GLOPA
MTQRFTRGRRGKTPTTTNEDDSRLSEHKRKRNGGGGGFGCVCITVCIIVVVIVVALGGFTLVVALMSAESFKDGPLEGLSKLLHGRDD